MRHTFGKSIKLAILKERAINVSIQKITIKPALSNLYLLW